MVKIMKQYKISMYYDDYIKHHEQIKGIDLANESNSIIFYTDKQTIDYLNLNNINYNIEFNLKDKFKNILAFKKFVFIMIVCMVFCVYLNTYRVQNITFNIDTPVNESIKEKIQVSHKKIFFFDFTTVDYQELSKELRSEYSCYEWITVSKKYDVIEVEIIKTGLNNKYEDDLSGDIIANKDGIVTSYVVHSGDVLIEKNQYVKKGDVLIQGEYYNKSISAKGLVLATTFEEQVYKIDKKIISTKATGVSKKYFSINIINNIFDVTKSKFENFEDEEKELFKIPFLFKISVVEHYEVKDEVYYYDLDSAKEYGYSKVLESFNKTKIIDEESLVNSIIITQKEYDDYFELTYLVKKNESIGTFNQR